MKKIFILSIILLFSLIQSGNTQAQTTNYSKKWENIDFKIKNGDVKSLVNELDNIYISAKKERNYEQSIKSLIYILGIKLSTQDFSLRQSSFPKKESITRLENEIDNSKGIEKSLLQNILAKVYFYNNYPSFRRKDGVDNLKNDSLYKEITSLFEESIANKEILLKKRVRDISAIVSNIEYSELSPSLYDILVNSYIDCLNNLKDVELQAKSKILELYDNLIEAHINDRDKSAYLYNKIQKLKILANGDNKIINNSLFVLAESNIKEPFATEIFCMLAKNLKKENKFKESVGICESALERSKPNKWTKDCESLLKQLKAISIKLQIPGVNKPDKPLPLVIIHKNISSFDITLYRNKSYAEGLETAKSTDKSEEKVYKKHIKLKEFDDYDVHTTIYRLDPLPKGDYKIVLSYNKNSTYKKSFKVGNIFYYTYNLNTNTQTIQFADFVTGAPLANQKVIFYSNSDTKSTSKTLKGYVKTDEMGRLRYNSENYPSNEIAYFPDLKDAVLILDRYLDRPLYSNSNSLSKITFFTDRSVYRPLQTIYFKGILSQTINDTSKVLANKRVRIFLKKDKEILSQQLISNEFGSVSGKFVIPSYAIGNYYLECSDYYGTYPIKVEQYKRPKFYIELNEIPTTNVLDSINVLSGKVMTYSGFPLQHSKISYSIRNEEQRMFGASLSSNDFSHQGSVVTDSLGNFIIKFIPKHKGQDINYYKLSMSVSDINGETHIKEKSFSVALYPNNLTINTKSKYYNNEKISFSIKMINSKAYTLPVSGDYCIYKLKPEDRVIFNTNFYSKNLYQLYEYKDFISYFPHLSYDLSKETELPVEKLVYSGKLNYNTDSITLDTKLKRGYYLIKAATILKGDTIKSKKVIKVYNSKTEKCVNNEFFRIYSDKREYNYGESATLNFMSDLGSGYVYLLKSAQLKSIPQKLNTSDIGKTGDEDVYVVKLRKGKGQLKVALNDKSDFNFDVLFISDVNYYHTNYRLNVKSKPKAKLEFKTKVFRDKTIPGSKEEWSFTIDNKEDKDIFEVVAAMYDASLDVIKSNSFERNLIPKFNNLKRNYIFMPRYFSTLNPNFIYIDSYFQQVNTKFNYISLPSFQYVYDNFLKYFESSNRYDVPMMSTFVGTPTNMMRKTKGLIVEGYNSSTSDQSNSEYNIDPTILNNPATTTLLNANDIQIRDNFDETAFFYPNIKTNEDGDFTIKFTSPESLTLWKLLLFGHNKNLDYGNAEFFMKTQKKLMVVPNMPRFLRMGDKIILSAKILNLSDKNLEGHVELRFLNDNTLNSNSELAKGNVNELFHNSNSIKTFKVKKDGSTQVYWEITVPEKLDLVKYQIIASTTKVKGENEFSDGEQNILPIISNKILITQTMPISLKAKESKKFYMNKLLNSNSLSLSNFSLTLNLTMNPIWDAIKALPYLSKKHFESSDQLFSRLYANIVSSYLLNSSPKIADFFKVHNSKKDFESNLEKNEELKSILLEETPWLVNARDEKETIKNLALLFNLNNIREEYSRTLQLLNLRVANDGGYPWFKGGKSNEMITTNIVAGFGKLANLLGKENLDTKVYTLVEKNINFLDKLVIDKINLASSKNIKFDIKNYIYYLYARSFWKDKYKLPKEITSFIPNLNKNIWEYYSLSLTLKSYYATILNRYGFKQSARKLVHNLKESSVESNIMGMYWKNNIISSGWFNSTIEAQTAAIEAFAEVTPNDSSSIEEMKVWLVQNKKVVAWNTPKATVEAVNCLLQHGTNWVDSSGDVTIKIADKKLDDTNKNFIKKVWRHSEVDKNLGRIEIENNSPTPILGGLYWQYTDNIAKIEASSSDAIIRKEMYVKENDGNKLNYIKLENLLRPLKKGEEILVRLIFTTDRDMQYIHIKDMRASGLEPQNMLSEYHYNRGIYYFEAIKDLSTNFFIEYLPKGVHEIEYSLIVNNAGTFSSGITVFQNLYAPEVSSNSSSTILNISN